MPRPAPSSAAPLLDFTPRVYNVRHAACSREGMSGTHHHVALEFPDHLGRIEHLKASNSEFSRLFEQYQEVSTELHYIEAKLETRSPAYVEELMQRRIHLKDEIHRMLSSI